MPLAQSIELAIKDSFQRENHNEKYAIPDLLFDRLFVHFLDRIYWVPEHPTGDE